jgi:hypothetical protein
MENIVVNNLTVTGEIIFPDFTTQNTSYVQFLKNFSTVARDEINNVTYFHTDDIVIEKNVTMPANVGMNTMSINSITFANDYLQTGNPSVQTYAFSSSMYEDITGTKQALDSLITDHFDRPNKRIKVTDTNKNVTIGSDFISLNNTFLRPGSLLGSVSDNFVIGRGNTLPRILFGPNNVKISAEEDDFYGSIDVTSLGAVVIKPATLVSCQGPLAVDGGITLEGGTKTITGSPEIYTPMLISPTFSGTVTGLTKSMVGLSNVDNTSDASKPVSTATQTALNLKANISSPSFSGEVNMARLIISSTLLDPFNIVNPTDFNGYFLGTASSNGLLNSIVTAKDSVIIARGPAATSTNGVGQGNGSLTLSCWASGNIGMRISCSETLISPGVIQDNGNQIKLQVGSTQLIQNATKFSLNKDIDITGTIKIFGSSNAKAQTSLVHDGINLSTLYIDSPAGGSAFTIKVNKSDNSIDDAFLVNANATRIKKPILPDYNVQPSSISHLGWVGIPTNITATKTQPISSSSADESFGNFSISQSGFFQVIVQIILVPNVNHIFDACRICIHDTSGTFPSTSTPEKWTHSIVNDVNGDMSLTVPNIYYLRANISNTANTTYYINYRLTWSGPGTINMSANFTALRIG